MPLARYFLFVGGTLIALLLMLNAWLPPVVSAPAGDVQRPVVRITSDRKLPERIVFDTAAPIVASPPVTLAAQPVKTPAFDALAQAAPADLQRAEPAKAEPKLPPKRKVAKRVVHQPVYAYGQPQFTYGPTPYYGQPRVKYAQGPQFGFFGPMLR
jgi:hypothetical protein